MSGTEKPNKVIGLEMIDYEITENDTQQEQTERQEITTLVEEGHPSHCAQRQIWGDGECECSLYAQGYNPYAWQNADRHNELNRVYSERNYAAILAVKLALKLGYKVGQGIDDNKNWNIEWRHVVYIDLPCGTQLSWHMSPKEVCLLDTLPQYTGKWDGKWSAKTYDFISEME